MRRFAPFFLLSFLVSCGSSATQDGGLDANVAADAGQVDAGLDAGGVDAGVDAGSKADGCASVFGSELTAGFGRVDGVVTAVVTPADTQCAIPNSDHVVIQVRLDGGVHRLVVNVLSTGADPNVRYRELEAPLPAPTWQEGWHVGLSLDYPTTLNAHSDAGFEPVPMAQLVPRVSNALTIGARVSVYASSSGGMFASSAHLVHRKGYNHDGAVVVDPDSTHPRWLLFHFSDQSF